jgi:hypothetical protein
VTYANAQTIQFPRRAFSFGQLFFAFLLISFSFISIYAQDNVSLNREENTLIITDARDAEIYAFGKTVIVKNSAKGVLAFGGDIIIEGRIEGDAAALGGSIIQKEGAFIGGDVVVIGGTYKYFDKEPLRNPGKETIMFASYEEELRRITQNPAELLAPDFSWSFLAQRLLSVLFWFVVSLALTTMAPGAVSRSVARIQLSAVKILAIGFLGFFATTLGVVAGLKFLPNYLSAVIGLMALVLVILAYVFGRVILQVSIGKWLQKRFLPHHKHSESIALLIGAFFWAAILSIPYLWTFALFLLFIVSLGVVLTARSPHNWQKI